MIEHVEKIDYRARSNLKLHRRSQDRQVRYLLQQNRLGLHLVRLTHLTIAVYVARTANFFD